MSESTPYGTGRGSGQEPGTQEPGTQEPGTWDTGTWEPEALVLDCDACVMQGTDTCRDCVVTYLVEQPEGAVVFDVFEERAIRSFAQAGLLPDIRYRKASGS